jgi:hypothetical protein
VHVEGDEIEPVTDLITVAPNLMPRRSDTTVVAVQHWPGRGPRHGPPLWSPVESPQDSAPVRAHRHITAVVSHINGPGLAPSIKVGQQVDP